MADSSDSWEALRPRHRERETVEEEEKAVNQRWVPVSNLLLVSPLGLGLPDRPAAQALGRRRGPVFRQHGDIKYLISRTGVAVGRAGIA